MDIVDFREYCLSLEGAEESLPFDEDTLVFKVDGKMFALASMTGFDTFLVKCDPDRAIELRDRYPEITPGFHMYKKHWNGVSVKGMLSDEFLREQIAESYRLVRKRRK